MLLQNCLCLSLFLSAICITRSSDALQTPESGKMAVSDLPYTSPGFQHYSSPSLVSRQGTSSDSEPLRQPFGHFLVFHQYLAFHDQTESNAAQISLLTAMARSAATEWQALNPCQKIDIVMGSLQITLISHAVISWNTVSSIANKLLALAMEGLNGFFGAAYCYEGPHSVLWTIGIGLGIATAAFGGVEAEFESHASNGRAALPAAEVIGASMLA